MFQIQHLFVLEILKNLGTLTTYLNVITTYYKLSFVFLIYMYVKSLKMEILYNKKLKSNNKKPHARNSLPLLSNRFPKVSKNYRSWHFFCYLPVFDSGTLLLKTPMCWRHALELSGHMVLRLKH